MNIRRDCPKQKLLSDGIGDVKDLLSTRLNSIEERINTWMLILCVIGFIFGVWQVMDMMIEELVK